MPSLRSRFFAASLLACAFTAHLSAATITWKYNFGSDMDWQTAANWVGGRPGANDIARLSNPVPGDVITNSVTNQQIGGIEYATTTPITLGHFTKNKFLLTNGATVNVTSAAGEVLTISGPIELRPTNTSSAVSLRLENNSSHAAAGLQIVGPISSATTSSTATVTLAGTNLNAAKNIVSGAFSNGQASSLAVEKRGAGAWTLLGSHLHTGTTTVHEGRLVFQGSLAGGLRVVDGVFQGSGTIHGHSSIESNGTLEVSAGAPLNFTGDLSLAGLTRAEISTLTSLADSRTISVAGTLTLGGALALVLDQIPLPGSAYQLFSGVEMSNPSSVLGSFEQITLFSGSDEIVLGNASAGLWTGTTAGGLDFLFSEQNGTLSFAGSPIPEPSTYAVIFGALSLASVIWRKRRPKSPSILRHGHQMRAQ